MVRRYTSVERDGSTVAPRLRKCANCGFRLHPPKYCGESRPETPNGTTSPVGRTNNRPCLAGFPGRSVARSPCTGTDPSRRKIAFCIRRRSALHNERTVAGESFPSLGQKSAVLYSCLQHSGSRHFGEKI